MDAVRRTLRGFPALFCSRLKGAFPTIFFYILQFLLVSVLFGQRYIIVITCSTTLFQLRHKQYNSPWDYTRMFLVSLLLCLLAYAATRNVVLCVLLNLAVPVVLVFWKSSQFTPKGYLGFAMTFVFLELRPPRRRNFPLCFSPRYSALSCCFPPWRCTPGCPLRPPTPPNSWRPLCCGCPGCWSGWPGRETTPPPGRSCTTPPRPST